ncbi:MAG TPA: hypothetical protein VNR61_20015 [Niallia sp.]|nr:hypothetical protein [Niallia sp.]
MSLVIRPMEMIDLERAKVFLSRAGLETEGIDESWNYFLLMEDKDLQELKGTVGIEPLGQIGLLRSMVLSQGRAEDILFLLQQVISLAKKKEMAELYCMVNNKNAVRLFHLLGFKEVKGEDIPTEVKESNYVKKLVPVNNLEFMRFVIEKVDK